MKRLLSIFVLSIFVLSVKGQVYQIMPQYGYGPVKRFDIDSSLTIPTTCGVPTLRTNLTKKSAIAFDTCNNRFYFYNAKTSVWDTIKGGSTIDTTSLSNRINSKIDSIKRSSDSVYSYKNGVRTFAYRDSIGSGSDTASVVKATVKNAEATTLTKGTVVYLYGATGNMASVKRAYNTSDTFSSKTFAIVKNDITAGGTGTVITQGVVDKLQLGAYTEGDIVWLDSIPGQFTNNKPSAPYHGVFIGVVERANNGNGQLYVKIQNGYELGELHNVSVNGQSNNDVLYYQTSTKLWKAKSAYQLVDTSQLSLRIDNRVKYSDTASMLTNYAKTSEVNLKVNISDTASMLTNYAKTSVVNLKLNTSDSSTYFTKYRSDTMRTNLYTNLLRKTDTSTLSTRIDLRLRYTDSATMLSNYFRKSDTLLSTKFRVNFSASTTDFPVIIKNTNASAVQSNVLSFDCSATGADQPVFVNLASTSAKGMVFFASNQATSSSPAGAGFQIYSTGSTNFPGQMYFDGGAHNSSSIIFRTAQTSGTITQRMRIFANGNVSISSSGTDAGYLLNVNGTMRASQFYLSALNTAPATAASTGTLGEIRIDANYIYICTATNTWKRAAIATW